MATKTTEATKPKTRKPKAPKVAELRTSHKKGLDEMSSAHRTKIERWEPMLSAIGAEHVWASSPRTSGRAPGLFYLAVKVASKNYAIVGFDTSTPTTKATVLVGSIASPKALLEQFGAYRLMAKAERTGVAVKTSKASAKKATTKASTPTKATKPKTLVRKRAPKAS